MKEQHKTALLAVAALAVILFLGVYFSPGATTITTTQAPSPAPTAIIQYVASAASGTPIEDGSCWTNSIAAPYRSDAWRCAVENSISDPCFEFGSPSNVLCGVNPADAENNKAFIVNLSSPLPKPQLPPGGAPDNWAWLVELEDGTLCTPFTGTRPFTAAGDSANYGCAPGPIGSEVMIFGDLDASRPIWTANIGSLMLSTSSLPTLENTRQISVKTVWQ